MVGFGVGKCSQFGGGCVQGLSAGPTARELQTCTFERPGLTPPKFHEKTPRETQKNRNGHGKRKKNAKFLGRGPTLRGPTLRAPLFLGSVRAPHPLGPHPLGPHPLGPHGSGPTLRGPTTSGPHHDTKNIPKNWIGQNHDGQNWIGQKLCQDGQNGIGQNRSLPSVTSSSFLLFRETSCCTRPFCF